MDWHTETVRTYDASAQEFVANFDAIGPLVPGIERGLALANASDNAHVVEIGCAGGREAAEIIPRVGQYEGFDPSRGLLEIARRRLPDASFVQADALSYHYPEQLDVVYAFASLLHIDGIGVKQVLGKVATSLRPGGVLLMTLKERPTYQAEITNTGFGSRIFYYYNAPIIRHLAGTVLTLTYEDHEPDDSDDWLTLGLQK